MRLQTQFLRKESSQYFYSWLMSNDKSTGCCALLWTVLIFIMVLAEPALGSAHPPEATQGFEAARTAEADRQFDHAIEKYREVVHRWPRSPEAPEAQLRLALLTARIGGVDHALLELQQVRNLFPDSPAAAKALEFLSTLYRWHRSQWNTSTTDVANSVPYQAKVLETGLTESFEDPQSAFFDRHNELVVFDKHRKRVLRFNASGEIRESIPFASPHAMARPGIEFNDESCVADGEVIRFLGKTESLTIPNPQKRTERNLKNITAIGLETSHSLWATSTDLTGVLHFTLPKAVAEAVGVSVVPKNIRSIEFDFYGNVYFFDSKQARILVVNPHGETRTMIAPNVGSFHISTITDFYIDFYNQLHLLDAEERTIAVYSIREADGKDLHFQPLTRVAWGTLIAGPEFRSIRSFTVHESGEIYLIPRKSSKILRIY